MGKVSRGEIDGMFSRGFPIYDARIIEVPDAGYTFVQDDSNSYLRSTSGSAATWTVPPASSIPFAIGDSITIEQAGAGQVTIAAGAGVTINSPATLKSNAQFSVVTLAKVGADEWTLAGDIAAP